MKIVSFLLGALLPLLSLQASHQEASKLTLTASATIEKPSNELQMKIGVITLGTYADETVATNSEKMQAVIESLLWLGLTKEDYETSHFSINPTYTPYPKDPPENWKPSINGYEVSNTILIHTPKLDIAGRIIDAANDAGANSITDIHFGLHDVREYWTEALAAAGKNAVGDARAIAEATGVKLVRVLSIALNHTQVHSPQLNVATMGKARLAHAPLPIEPGDVSITANVTLIYEIE